ncbi:MAG: TIGR03619 family F420-dependent LLM class oxidoreductase [Dehalococcoidia bacterium]
MKLGTIFPQNIIGNDPVFIRDYAQTIEGAGYDYLLAYEHVTGAHPDRFNPPPFPFRPEASGTTYTHETPWHEPLTLYSHLMAVTTTLEFVTSVLLLAQRQTVLVAKQVAELQILSGDRLRLAVGIGWNFTEYEALGMDWHTRTERIEEQMKVLKMLWSEPLVTFEGKHHHLDRVGLNPLPKNVPEIWYASSGRDVVLKRVAQYCDGWMPLLLGGEDAAESVEKLHNYVREFGKDPATFGIDARGVPGVSRMRTGSKIPTAGLPDPDAPLAPLDAFVDGAKGWKALGASHYLAGPGGHTAKESLERAVQMAKIFENEVGRE